MAVALAGFSALLYRYFQNDQVAIAVSRSGDSSVGFHSFSASFKDDVSFLALAKASAVFLDSSQLSLEQVLRFGLPAGSPEQHQLSEIVDAYREVPGSSDQDEMWVTCETVDGTLHCEFLKTPRTALALEAFRDHFKTLVEAGLRSPDEGVRGLQILGPSERHTMLVEWNRADCGYPTEGIFDHLRKQVLDAPTRIALTAGRERLTYEDFYERVCSLGLQLRAAGVGPGHIVAVCADPSIDSIAALFSVLFAGAAYVALDPEHPRDYLRKIIVDAGVKLVLSNELSREEFRVDGVTIIGIKEALLSAPAAIGLDSRLPVRSLDDLAYLTYTSGTTGEPKGVLCTDRSILNGLNEPPFEDAATEVCSLNSPLSYGFSVARIVLPLLMGASIVIVPRELWPDLRQMVSHWAATRVNNIILVTALCRQLVELPTEALEKLRLRVLIVGGSTVPRQLVLRLREQFPTATLIVAYGASEFGGAALIGVHGAAGSARTNTVGRPFPNTHAYILDRSRNPVPIGVLGELFIGSAHLALGYHRRPELTADRFVIGGPAAPERLYRTGDLARFHATGEVEIGGRVDDQVKIRGVRVELEHVERALAELDQVSAAMVYAENHRGENRLIAFYISRDTSADARDIRAALDRKLPKHMIPAVFMKVDALPENSVGKPDRKALATLSRKSPRDEETRRDEEIPRDELEAALAKIWAAALASGPIGIHDDFVDAGGDSLIAAAISMQIADEFGVELPIVSILNYPTIALLADQLRLELRGSDKHT